MSIKENLDSIRERIAAAARRAARNPDDILLMAVTKTFGADTIRQAHAAGQRLFGENRVQEFAAIYDSLHDLADADFHMIGHLQSNKASKAIEIFTAVDSVDSLRLAEKLNAAAATARKRLPVLIELNLGGEESKSGLNPVSPAFGELLEAAPRLEALDFRGLMTIPPFTDDPQAARPYFRRLREIRDNLARRNLSGIGLATLSMGMSHDFEIAIEEGSTCVRLGTALFGNRAKPH
ncbi:MAG: YggS family pyridoxal phosphate-dependent enzyme [Terriglobales bacterium]